MIYLTVIMIYFLAQLTGAEISKDGIVVSEELNRPIPQLSLLHAVELTLMNQLDIQLSGEQFSLQQGVLQESAGPFDPLFDNDDLFIVRENAQNPGGPVRTRRTGHHTLITGSARKKTRLGTQYALSVGIDQEIDPSSVPHVVNTSIVAFTVNQPLLRGLMYGRDTVIEQANYLEVDAAYFDLLEQVSQRIFDTVSAYWEMVSAKKIKRIIAQSVERFLVLADNVRRLIKEDQAAASDIVQPLAQLASRKIDLQLAEQEYYRRFEELKFAMNTVEEIPCIDELVFELDDFPPIELSFERLAKIRCRLLERAAEERYSIFAAQKRAEAAAFLVEGARNGLLPKLDVIGGVARKNFANGKTGKRLYHAFDEGVPEIDWTVGVSFSMPLYNDTAKGILRQQLAAQAQKRIVIQQLTQQALAETREAVNNHMTILRNLREAEEAVKENQILVDNESKKLRAGFSTLFFLIDFENKLTDALVQQVLIQKAYFQNIAHLRFLSSTLFMLGECIDFITPENLTSLPE